MALHDVDKNNNDRTSPVVNAHDSQDLAARMAHGTNSTNYTTDATNADLTAGIFNGFFEIVRIMEETVAAPVFDTGTNTWGAQNNSVVVPHGLDFVPTVIGSVALVNDDGTISDNSFALMPDTKGFIGTSNNPYFYQWQAYPDSTNITFWINVTAYNTHTSAANYFMRVYLLRQKATSALTS